MASAHANHAHHDEGQHHAKDSPPAARPHACDCTGHRIAEKPRTASQWGWLSNLVPILACALCPVCLSAYATILSALGVGFALTEGQHALLLGIAVAAALLAGIWRARMTRRYEPLGICMLGCAMLVFADILHENRALAIVGIILLVIAMLWDKRSGKKRASSQAHSD